MMIKFNNPTSGTNSSINNHGVNNVITPTKKKCRKKPDPTAPKITRPCSECGKKFWSQKALFGHMRCHPERQWRGINPPPNLINRHHNQNSSVAVASMASSGTKFDDFSKMTQDDHDAALSLLMLANGFGSTSTMVAHANCSDQFPSSENAVSVKEGVVVMSSGGGGGDVEVVPGSGGRGNCGFECLNCKKVFGSPQALGGHRASHKNVKGCFANTRNNDGVFLEDGVVVVEEDNEKMLMLGLGLGLNLGIQEQQQQHQCNICFRMFSSGQALGGHKRCHWEKFDGNDEELGIDLNLVGTITPPSSSRMYEGDSSCCLHSSCSEALDLSLGL